MPPDRPSGNDALVAQSGCARWRIPTPVATDTPRSPSSSGTSRIVPTERSCPEAVSPAGSGVSWGAASGTSGDRSSGGEKPIGSATTCRRSASTRAGRDRSSRFPIRAAGGGSPGSLLTPTGCTTWVGSAGRCGRAPVPSESGKRSCRSPGTVRSPPPSSRPRSIPGSRWVQRSIGSNKRSGYPCSPRRSLCPNGPRSGAHLGPARSPSRRRARGRRPFGARPFPIRQRQEPPRQFGVRDIYDRPPRGPHRGGGRPEPRGARPGPVVDRGRYQGPRRVAGRARSPRRITGRTAGHGG